VRNSVPYAVNCLQLLCELIPIDSDFVLYRASSARSGSVVAAWRKAASQCRCERDLRKQGCPVSSGMFSCWLNSLSLLNCEWDVCRPARCRLITYSGGYVWTSRCVDFQEPQSLHVTVRVALATQKKRRALNKSKQAWQDHEERGDPTFSPTRIGRHLGLYAVSRVDCGLLASALTSPPRPPLTRDEPPYNDIHGWSIEVIDHDTEATVLVSNERLRDTSTPAAPSRPASSSGSRQTR
jgi:hypothetical protein